VRNIKHLAPPLPVLLVLGIGIRLLLAPYTAWSPDVHAWATFAQEVAGGLDPYASRSFSYPVAWAYVLGVVTRALARFMDPGGYQLALPALRDLAGLTHVTDWRVTTPAFNLAVKLPAIAADGAIGALLHGLVAPRRGEEAGRRVAGAWLLNPLAIFVSAVHGQFDALAALLSLVALVLLVDGRRFLAGAALALAVLTKAYPIVLALPWAAAVAGSCFRGAGLAAPRRAAVALLAPGAGALGAAALLLWPTLGGAMGTTIASRGGTVTVGGGLNPWFVQYVPGGAAVVEAHAGAFGGVLTALFLLLLAALAIRAFRACRAGAIPLPALAGTSAAVLVGLLLTSRATNPQYLVWALPFLLLWASLGRPMALPIAAITAAGLGFYAAMLNFALAALLLPLAVYTRLLPLETVLRQVRRARYQEGWWNGQRFEDWMLISAAGGCLALAWALWLLLRTPAGDPATGPDRIGERVARLIARSRRPPQPEAAAVPGRRAGEGPL